MYFDTHAHYYDKRFNDDRDELLSSMPAAGISYILSAGSNVKSSKFCVELANKYSFIYAAVGVHPHDAKSMNENTISELQELFSDPKVVAVGETGLDYHYDFSPRDVQKICFREQLELARHLGKPIIVHERESLNDTLEMICEFKDIKGVLHCFSGSWETAKIILDMGWYLSFGGVITFKNARRALEVIEKMPLDRIMLETDCPYLAPEPKRGRRNSSLYLPYIAEKIADVRGITREEVATATTENGKRFFEI
ncbi:MAG: TatD family hydrolase [Oscillospiraceae bacterium]|nr:TatD family hydrolase [Oscillospiraceae bacterium]